LTQAPRKLGSNQRRVPHTPHVDPHGSQHEAHVPQLPVEQELHPPDMAATLLLVTVLTSALSLREIH
jgi:hypothetical protein